MSEGLAVILAGSNIEPEKHLPAAIQALGNRVRILATSPIYETPPVGAPGTPPFLNMAILVATDLLPDQLRTRVLKPIEDQLGRVRHPGDPNAPRTIDLDLVLYRKGDEEVTEEEVTAHAHVAIPVADVVPEWILPSGKRMADVAARFAAARKRFRRRPDVEHHLRRFRGSPPPTEATTRAPNS